MRAVFILSAFVIFSLLFSFGCGEQVEIPESEDFPADVYQPFDTANMKSQVARVQAYEDIVSLTKSPAFSAKDFEQIEKLYATADLNKKVAGRTDDHTYAPVKEIGKQLDKTITDAIAKGKKGEAIKEQAQIIDKTLQRFFYLSVYHEMVTTKEKLMDKVKTWDEAFGYYGRSTDGKSSKGISKTVEKRDAEFKTGLNKTIFNGLIAGRNALAKGEQAEVDKQIEVVDNALLKAFALSVLHEVEESAKASDGGAIQLLEARLYYQIIEPKVKAVDAAGAKTISDELAKAPKSVDLNTIKTVLSRVFL